MQETRRSAGNFIQSQEFRFYVSLIRYRRTVRMGPTSCSTRRHLCAIRQAKSRNEGFTVKIVVP